MIACGSSDESWSTITAEGEQTPLSVYTMCPGRYNVKNPANNNPPWATLMRVSPDFEYVAGWQHSTGDTDPNAVNNGPAQHAGYRSADDNQSSFTDLSGVDSDSYSQKDVQDNKVIFNPVTSDVWWQRDDDFMMSSARDDTSPTREGKGFLYTFDPEGKPMPMPYLDSPSGRRRAVITENGYSATLWVGNRTTLTSECLQKAGVTHHSDTVDACGAREVDGDTFACDQVDDIAGWLSDTELVCLANSQVARLEVGSNGKITDETALTPETARTLRTPLVSPDTKTVFFLGVEDSDSEVTLYKAPTDGDTEAEPAEVTSWSDGSVRTLLAWRDEATDEQAE